MTYDKWKKTTFWGKRAQEDEEQVSRTDKDTTTIIIDTQTYEPIPEHLEGTPWGNRIAARNCSDTKQ